MCVANWMGPNCGALDFTNSTERYRLSQLGIHPSQWTPLLIEAAKDIGQSWKNNSLCGELWSRADNPVPDNPWRPKPNDWCGDFVRGKIRDYSGLPILPCCDQGDREPLWYYFGRLDEYFCDGQLRECDCVLGDDWSSSQNCVLDSYCGRYRISFRDDNPFTMDPDDNYTWESLADPSVVRPGYIASLMSANRDLFHQTIFLEWDSAPSPGRCTASFRAIGGNQGDRTNIRTFTLCNGAIQGCWDNYCVPNNYYTWGGLNDNDDEARSLFGRPWLWPGDE